MEETTRQVSMYPGEDETAYLLQSEANKRRLLRAIDNVAHQQNLVEVAIASIASCVSHNPRLGKRWIVIHRKRQIQNLVEAQQEV